MAKVFPHNPKKPAAARQRVINPHKGLSTTPAPAPPPALPQVSPLVRRKKPAKTVILVSCKEESLYFVFPDKSFDRLRRKVNELQQFLSAQQPSKMSMRIEVILVRPPATPEGRTYNVIEIQVSQSIIGYGEELEKLFSGFDEMVASAQEWMRQKLLVDPKKVVTIGPRRFKLEV